MMFSVEPVWELLSRHLDACMLRQAVYSSNIANASVPGYQPLEVDFESQLRSASALLQAAPAEAGDLLQTIQPQIVRAPVASVELDQQLALMSQNALQYQQLLRAFERSIGLLRLAVLEGKES
jgi:flagellar basal-body rod protein FlgB